MANEESILQSIEELGGIPEIELELSVSGMTAYPTDKTLSTEDMAADAKETGDRINDVQAAIADVASDVAIISAWTGEIIPLHDESEVTIAEAFDRIIDDPYPVGSIYMTIGTGEPIFPGTWTEIAITATWNQLKSGTRGYTALGSGATGGTVHFWLRTA